jgi:hypothetical protein
MDPVKTTEAAAEIAKAATWGERLERRIASLAEEPIEDWIDEELDGDDEAPAFARYTAERDAFETALEAWTLSESRIASLIHQHLQAVAKIVEPHDHIFARALKMNEPGREE